MLFVDVLASILLAAQAEAMVAAMMIVAAMVVAVVEVVIRVVSLRERRNRDDNGKVDWNSTILYLPCESYHCFLRTCIRRKVSLEALNGACGEGITRFGPASM